MLKLLLNGSVLTVFSRRRSVRVRGKYEGAVLKRADAVWRCCSMLALAWMGATVVLAQQAAPPSRSSDSQVLQQLLDEVRQLRRTCERASAAGARLQIVLQRMQLEQNQLNRIDSKLESVRDDLMTAESQQAQSSSQLSDLENRLSQEQDPNRRKELQEQQKEMKMMLEEQTRSMQDLRTREGELLASSQGEQAKLNEFQERLDALEKAVVPPPAPEEAALAR
jgi:chromosome segregation ATPase